MVVRFTRSACFHDNLNPTLAVRKEASLPLLRRLRPWLASGVRLGAKPVSDS